MSVQTNVPFGLLQSSQELDGVGRPTTRWADQQQS